jgi:hypothetical protein
MNAARRSADQPTASHPEESFMATPDMSSSPSSPAPTTLGQLADETPDVMTLHTQDAYRMFTGRSGDAATSAPAIPGGRRFAAVLKSIWYLSANDNPYADWILIRVYQSLVAIRAQMAQAIEVREAEQRRLEAERTTPDYQAKTRAQREKISKLIDDMKKRMGTGGRS